MKTEKKIKNKVAELERRFEKLKINNFDKAMQAFLISHSVAVLKWVLNDKKN